MRRDLFWIIASTICIVSIYFFVYVSRPQLGGDIVEYYGMTESFISHGDWSFSERDLSSINRQFGSFETDSPEHYPTGIDGRKYAFHFFLYSALNVPTRLALAMIGENELKTFQITNLLILAATIFIICRKFLLPQYRRYLFLTLMIFSPLASFLSWPGPEMFIVCMLTLGIFYFYHHEYKHAVIFTALAAWQSQPLAIICSLMMAFALVNLYRQKKLTISVFLIYALLSSILLIPNLYYWMVFGTPTGFSQIEGLGFSNFSFLKIAEIFFDPNIGLFFFMPFIFIAGAFFFFKYARREWESRVLLLGFLTIPFFYTVTTNWNHGSAGFTPSRYALCFVPFFIFFITRALRDRHQTLIGIALIIITQTPFLTLNGFLTPDFNNSFRLTPLARIILDKMPDWYNPTPEIFVERITGRESGGAFDTTIFKNNGGCRKALVLKTNLSPLMHECGYMPTHEELYNPYLTPTTYARPITTKVATLWPTDDSCRSCLSTLEDAMKATHIVQPRRLKKIGTEEGVWQVAWGVPITFTVPPGYIVHYYPLDPYYVNFPPHTP